MGQALSRELDTREIAEEVRCPLGSGVARRRRGGLGRAGGPRDT